MLETKYRNDISPIIFHTFQLFKWHRVSHLKISSTFRLQMGMEGEEEQQHNMIVRYQHGVVEENYNIKFFKFEKILAYHFMFATLQFTGGTWIILRNGHQNNNYHDNICKVDAL